MTLTYTLPKNNPLGRNFHFHKYEMVFRVYLGQGIQEWTKQNL